VLRVTWHSNTVSLPEFAHRCSSPSMGLIPLTSLWVNFL